VVTFHANANNGGDRSTTVVFKTTDDSGKEYTAQATINQKGAIVACTVAEFLEAPVGETLYRITGVITKVANTTYGNVYIRDWSGETYVYGIGSQGDFEAAGLKAGDIVTLVGKRGEYKGTPQMTGASLEASIPVTPISIDEFLDKEDNPNVYYMITGTITEIANPAYGNVYLDDGTNSVYVYGCYPGWGATGDNRKGLFEREGIEVGDIISIIGVKATYQGAAQMSNGIYFSHQKPE
jgi:RPA family protein